MKTIYTYLALLTCSSLSFAAEPTITPMAFQEDALIAQSENLSIPGLNPRGLPLTPAQAMELVTQYHEEEVGQEGQVGQAKAAIATGNLLTSFSNSATLNPTQKTLLKAAAEGQYKLGASLQFYPIETATKIGNKAEFNYLKANSQDSQLNQKQISGRLKQLDKTLNRPTSRTPRQEKK